MGNYAIAIHGGAGRLMTGVLTPEQEKAYHEKLSEALQVGYTILSNGGSAVDTVEATVRILEDSPLFNAGKGSVFNCEGQNEMDASIMNGKNLKAGAIAAVHTIRNPVTCARAVMEKSPHVLLAGHGAEKFAEEVGIEIVSPSYFYDEERYTHWLHTKDLEGASWAGDTYLTNQANIEKKLGTVGCVALDSSGNLAAATSTGGVNNKKFGRVGDSPIIGAGTYADNKTCAVSCTGEGEYFIRQSTAYDIAALIEYKGFTVAQAATEAIKKIAQLGGEGGLIAIDNQGNISVPFNTSSMFRGWINAQGEKFTGIFR
ncbi:MAG TPA: isoaspartyl peptidase/L-asparaginase [Bacteroidia bacterium]|jgi:beta-aspartyl-peptidase (threonine type)|nr:isoaspartyl peptidase/L-asparaginase [Bacteroidia bacterium]